MKRLWNRRILAVLCICSFVLLFIPEKANADVFDNAYEYFNAYGSEMTFQAGNHMEGLIYYGTKAKLAASNKTRFVNVGWRVTVKNSAGTVIDQIYYSIDGAYMKKEDTREIDGYKYSLYCLSLTNLKSRLSKEACEALKQANCDIVFDACIVVIVDDVRQGAMTDDGVSWGNVYMTYDGIVSAKNWSKATKTLLKTYYNKTIPDMFFEVKLSKGTGIANVQGAGKYCFGTEIMVEAIPEGRFIFSKWIGTKSSNQKKFTFTLYEDVSMTAIAIQDLPPEITGADVYVSLDAAQNGQVTEKWLADYVKAQDAEDGAISYGKNAKNAFYMVDFQVEDYTAYQKEGYVTQTFYAVDSVGNEAWKTIKVYLVEDRVYDTYLIQGRIRFISSKYYKDDAGNFISEENGGLWAESIWRLKSEYVNLLDDIFQEV